MSKYRIVIDNYLGYEAQIKRWWFPFWTQLNGLNTHITIEQAKEYIERNKNKVVWGEKR